MDGHRPGHPDKTEWPCHRRRENWKFSNAGKTDKPLPIAGIPKGLHRHAGTARPTNSGADIA